jgi:hypothetical protein
LENLSSSDAKALRHKYEPTFDGKFELVCPKLDESMGRWWKKIDGKLPTVKLNNPQENAWQSVQYSVLDSFRPALSLWSKIPEDSPLLGDVEALLKLMGKSFQQISKQRRANAIRHVAPSMLPALKDERMFSSREYKTYLVKNSWTRWSKMQRISTKSRSSRGAVAAILIIAP